MALGPPLGAPIQALAVREGIVLALADTLHVLRVDPEGGGPPQPLGHEPLLRRTRDVRWVGRQAWLRSRDVVTRLDLSEPSRPRPIIGWRPAPPSSAHRSGVVRELLPLGEHVLALLSWKGADPATPMLGELVLLDAPADRAPTELSRIALPRCCPEFALAQPGSGHPADPTADTFRRLLIVDFRGAAWHASVHLAAGLAELHLDEERLSLPPDLGSPAALAWMREGLWWAHRDSLNLVDIDDGAQPPRTLRLLMDEGSAGPRLLPVAGRLLAASDTRLWWVDPGARLLRGPALDTWPAAQVALGDEVAWLRGEGGGLRWASHAEPSIAAEAVGAPDAVSDMAADADRLWVVDGGAFRRLRDLGGGQLVQDRVLPARLVGASNSPRFWDAAEGEVAVQGVGDYTYVYGWEADDPDLRETRFVYHGSGPTAARLAPGRLLTLCVLRGVRTCQLRSHVLGEAYGDREPPGLPLPVAPAPAPTIGIDGDLVALGLGGDLVLVHAPLTATVPPRFLGQLDVPGTVREIVLDRQADTGTRGAWVLTDGSGLFGRAGGTLSWVDLGDPVVPREALRAIVGTTDPDLEASGGRAWVLTDGAVQVYEASAPERPPKTRLWLPRLTRVD